MVIQRRMRCSICSVEWWEGRYSQPKHDCTPPLEPAKVECDAPQYHDGSANKWYRYCPRCGVRLPEA